MVPWDGHPNPSIDLLVEGLDTRDELTEERGRPIVDLVTIPLHDGDPRHVVRIGLTLNEGKQLNLVVFL